MSSSEARRRAALQLALKIAFHIGEQHQNGGADQGQHRINQGLTV